MSRPVWDWAESPGTRLQEKPRLLAVQFGDGYSQRQADGLNAVVQSWDMRFDAVSREAGDEMLAFLRAQGGVTAFQWTPLWAAAPILVLCQQWSRSALDDFGFSDISATFIQAFEP